ncbi:MAG TPA: CpsD/CapB family tyrosine-protein kinase [Gammaproteobacteria bacterium]
MTTPNEHTIKVTTGRAAPPQVRAEQKTEPKLEQKERRHLQEINTRQVDQHLVSVTEPDSYEAEQYRKLRYVLEEKRKPGKSMVIGVCSPAAGDGKSLTATNLAAALAQARDSKVILIDVDLRRESVSLKAHLNLGTPGGLGLTDAILDGLSLQDVTRPLGGTNLSVVLTGTRTSAPYELLRSPRLETLIAEATRHYTYVVLDAPPVVPVSDCRVIARLVESFLMVVSAHRTPRPMLEEALDLIGPDKLLGLVFNRGDLMPRSYYGYYRYGKPMRDNIARRTPRVSVQGIPGDG